MNLTIKAMRLVGLSAKISNTKKGQSSLGAISY